MTETLLADKYASYRFPTQAELIFLLQIAIRVRDGKKVTHEGIKVEFVGSIGIRFPLTLLKFTQDMPELFYDRGHHHEFLSLSQELAAPGEMRQAQTYDFNFKNVEKQFESYQGVNVKLR